MTNAESQTPEQLALPFALSSTVTVTFTNEQLVAIAIDSVIADGHALDASTLKPVFNKTGLTLTAQTIVGEPAPKKRRAKRKTKKKATSKKTEAKETKEAEGNNPFVPTTETQEEVIAQVKAEAGVPESAPFSTETMEIEESDSGEAPLPINPFNFDEVGVNS